MGRRLIARTLLVLALLVAARSHPVGQGKGYDELSSAQRRLLQTWADGGPSPDSRDRQARERFDAAPQQFRIVFDQLTGRLAALILSDPENGEVLGAAIDLIEAAAPPERQPARPGATEDTLAVVLASGARDRLRRSSEFERVADGTVRDQIVFEHTGPPAIRVTIASSGSSGEVSMSRR